MIRNFIFSKKKSGRDEDDEGDEGGDFKDDGSDAGGGGGDGMAEWRPLVSVDFESHGSAPPGHWHLNQTPEGDMMPHWGPGKGNKVFHGDPRHCPLWWQLIPKGCIYKQTPPRHLLAEHAAGGAAGGGGGGGEEDDEDED